MADQTFVRPPLSALVAIYSEATKNPIGVSDLPDKNVQLKVCYFIMPFIDVQNAEIIFFRYRVMW